MTAYYSTLSGWMIPFSKAMQNNGIDINQALLDCAIIPKDFAEPESRIAAEKLALLLDYCNQRLPNKDITVQVARQFHPGMFHALGYAMMCSNSLKDALARIVQYKRVVSNTCSLSLQQHDENLWFRMHLVCYPDSQRPVVSYTTVEAFLTTIMQFARLITNETLCPKQVLLRAPCSVKPYLQDFFGCDILFDQQVDALLLDSHQASQRLLTSNPMLTQAHERMLDEFLVRLDKDDLIHNVKANIYQRLPLGTPQQSEIATELGMSLRNLQRRLQEKGSSYKDILEQTRRNLALDYIAQAHLSLGEIGYLVGFSSVGNFNKAFKRWTGQSPGEYRAVQRRNQLLLN